MHRLNPLALLKPKTKTIELPSKEVLKIRSGLTLIETETQHGSYAYRQLLRIGLSDARARVVANKLKIHSYDANDQICAKGDYLEYWHLIMTGLVSALRQFLKLRAFPLVCMAKAHGLASSPSSTKSQTTPTTFASPQLTFCLCQPPCCISFWKKINRLLPMLPDWWRGVRKEPLKC